ncbi:hypothetical protein GGR51DRAFT_514943 [Nemania sp. FL0031]|nr:hypothetical protein GGR51DRAFT_514943 [Nemania sp. FL0031]
MPIDVWTKCPSWSLFLIMLFIEVPSKTLEKVQHVSSFRGFLRMALWLFRENSNNLFRVRGKQHTVSSQLAIVSSSWLNSWGNLYYFDSRTFSKIDEPRT